MNQYAIRLWVLVGLLGGIFVIGFVSGSVSQRSAQAQLPAVGGEVHAEDQDVSAALQHELTQAEHCYGIGVDLVGVGDVSDAKEELKKCFTDDFDSSYEFPGPFSSLNFTTTGGWAGFADTVNPLYRTLGLVRTQHTISNVRVARTGAHTGVVRFYLLAIHVRADESVLNMTATFLDDVMKIGGQWKIAHRTVKVTSAWTAPAWVP